MKSFLKIAGKTFLWVLLFGALFVSGTSIYASTQDRTLSEQFKNWGGYEQTVDKTDEDADADITLPDDGSEEGTENAGTEGSETGEETGTENSGTEEDASTGDAE